jgi:hypothetical protein
MFTFVKANIIWSGETFGQGRKSKDVGGRMKDEIKATSDLSFTPGFSPVIRGPEEVETVSTVSSCDCWSIFNAPKRAAVVIVTYDPLSLRTLSTGR